MPAEGSKRADMIIRMCINADISRLRWILKIRNINLKFHELDKVYHATQTFS